MIDLRRCRSILGPDCPLTDGQVELLRDQLAAFADIALETALQEVRNGTADIFSVASSLVPEAHRAQLAERASIAEFEGRARRGQAERTALRDYTRSLEKSERIH
jgi:hypothetical protein